MENEQRLDHLLRFFKALGEPHRLRIVGLLAQKPYTVEQLSEALSIGVSTVSHHLARLSDAGLVTARAEGYYSIYSLKTEILASMAQTLLKEVEAPHFAGKSVTDTFDRKVLETFTTPEGRIKTFPAQEKKLLVLLRHVVNAFEFGVRYPEKRVNQILANFNEDTAKLRRALVDYGLMAREGGGGKYWRLDSRST
jgi:predicted transcriptional regulator